MDLLNFAIQPTIESMIPYSSKSGKQSGVTAYEIGHNYITVQFASGDKYLYSYKITGIDSVEQMKILAKAQSGLSTYISRNNPDYETKF